MEVLTLIDMLNQYLIPAMKKTININTISGNDNSIIQINRIVNNNTNQGEGLLLGLQTSIKILNEEVAKIHAAPTLSEKVCIHIYEYCIVCVLVYVGCVWRCNMCVVYNVYANCLYFSLYTRSCMHTNIRMYAY